MALCLNPDSASSGSLEVLHSLQVQSSVSAADTLLDSLYCIASLVQETMNSSVMMLKGSFRVLFFPYRAVVLKLCNRPSHLQR